VKGTTQSYTTADGIVIPHRRPPLEHDRRQAGTRRARRAGDAAEEPERGERDRGRHHAHGRDEPPPLAAPQLAAPQLR
jgi:hypothetical protein